MALDPYMSWYSWCKSSRNTSLEYLYKEVLKRKCSVQIIITEFEEYLDKIDNIHKHACDHL